MIASLIGGKQAQIAIGFHCRQQYLYDGRLFSARASLGAHQMDLVVIKIAQKFPSWIR